jgi:hypothetical protein
MITKLELALQALDAEAQRLAEEQDELLAELSRLSRVRPRLRSDAIRRDVGRYREAVLAALHEVGDARGKNERFVRLACNRIREELRR